MCNSALEDILQTCSSRTWRVGGDIARRRQGVGSYYSGHFVFLKMMHMLCICRERKKTTTKYQLFCNGGNTTYIGSPNINLIVVCCTEL